MALNEKQKADLDNFKNDFKVRFEPEKPIEHIDLLGNTYKPSTYVVQGINKTGVFNFDQIISVITSPKDDCSEVDPYHDTITVKLVDGSTESFVVSRFGNDPLSPSNIEERVKTMAEYLRKNKKPR